ncbi:MAG: hypothetical protein ACRC7G_04710 [Beijerinckiaceae bacterium]
MHKDHDETVLTPTEARQGRPGRPVLIVLLFSLLLAAIYMLISLLWLGPDDGEKASGIKPSPQILTQLPTPNSGA